MVIKLKIITITCLRAKNYGAVLQAFALHKTLLKLGFDNLLLDYPYEKSIYEKINSKSLKEVLINIYLNINTFFRRKKLKCLSDSFNDFVSDNFTLTKCYNNILELTQTPPKADVYLTGSDQVFSPSSNDFFNTMRFLDFGENNIKRISYAASVGNYDLTDIEKKYVISKLKRFNALSLREKTGIDYYQSFYANNYYNHIDPIFLFNKEEWTKYCINLDEKKYILVFPLLGNKAMQSTIDKIKRKSGLKVISIQTRSDKIIKADKYIFDATPFEFISYIKNAEYVITTSFHGTAFSILFEKEFYTLIKEYRPQRMECLLKMVGLENRLIKNKFIFQKKINYEPVRKIIVKEREKSINYLREVYKL